MSTTAKVGQLLNKSIIGFDLNPGNDFSIIIGKGGINTVTLLFPTKITIPLSKKSISLIIFCIF